MTIVDELKPLAVIPETWLRQVNCPVCGCGDLTLKRYISAADQVLCNACNTVFEVSQDSNHSRLIAYPPGVPEGLTNRWISLERMQVDLVSGAATALPAQRVHRAIDRAELLERAEKLLEIGNPPEKVRTTLLSIPGVDREQVEEVYEEIRHSRPSRHSGLFWAGVSVLVILVLAIAAVVGLGLSRQRPQESSANLPSTAQRLITASGGLLKLEPVQVFFYESNGRRTSCPTQQVNAAKAFGAEAAMWSQTLGGWTLISMRPQTVYIPEGMSGAYPLIDDNPRMVKVAGPASLQNAIYVELDCDN